MIFAEFFRKASMEEVRKYRNNNCYTLDPFDTRLLRALHSYNPPWYHHIIEAHSSVNEKEIKDEIPTNCEVKQFVGIFLGKITTQKSM